jgi:hypothetical protein
MPLLLRQRDVYSTSKKPTSNIYEYTDRARTGALSDCVVQKNAKPKGDEQLSIGGWQPSKQNLI